MAQFRDFVRSKVPERVTQDSPGAEELFVNKDWDTPPADPALAADKRNWGGSRVSSPMTSLDQTLSAAWPSFVALGAKPAVFAKLSAMAADTNPDLQADFDDWKARGLIL